MLFAACSADLSSVPKHPRIPKTERAWRNCKDSWKRYMRNCKVTTQSWKRFRKALKETGRDLWLSGVHHSQLVSSNIWKISWELTMMILWNVTVSPVINFWIYSCSGVHVSVPYWLQQLQECWYQSYEVLARFSECEKFLDISDKTISFPWTKNWLKSHSAQKFESKNSISVGDWGTFNLSETFYVTWKKAARKRYPYRAPEHAGMRTRYQIAGFDFTWAFEYLLCFWLQSLLVWHQGYLSLWSNGTKPLKMPIHSKLLVKNSVGLWNR